LKSATLRQGRQRARPCSSTDTPAWTALCSAWEISIWNRRAPSADGWRPSQNGPTPVARLARTSLPQCCQSRVGRHSPHDHRGQWLATWKDNINNQVRSFARSFVRLFVPMSQLLAGIGRIHHQHHRPIHDEERVCASFYSVEIRRKRLIDCLLLLLFGLVVTRIIMVRRLCNARDPSGRPPSHRLFFLRRLQPATVIANCEMF
jgi:hypothetical protein